MAETVLRDPYLSVNGVDLSSYVRSVTLSYGAEPQDKTASGDGSRTNLAGMKDWSVEVEMNQDYAGAAVDATLFPLVGADPFGIEVRPSQAAVSTTNPSYTGQCIIEAYQPLGGTVGEMNLAPATFRPSSDLVRATT